MNIIPLHEIKATDYIGNSLPIINSNFISLDTNTQDLLNRVNTLNQSLSTVNQNINALYSVLNTNYICSYSQLRMTGSRLSQDSSLIDNKFKVKNSQSIYLHPVNSGYTSFYNTTTSTWDIKVIPGIIECSIAKLNNNTLYNTYLRYDEKLNLFATTFKVFNTDTNTVIDGVRVNTDNFKERYIGCFYKGYVGIDQIYSSTQLSDNIINQHIWNNNNQITTTVRGFNDFKNYPLLRPLPRNSKNINVFNNADGEKTFWNKNNTFNFVCGEKTSIQVVYNTFVNINNKNAYIGISLNDPYKPIRDNLTLLNQSADGIYLLSCSLKIDAQPGLNSVYTFDAGEEGVIFNTRANSYYEVTILN